MNTTIKVIPEEKHRYDTCGDYWYDKHGHRQIRVTDLHNEDSEELVAIHEMIESVLSRKARIDEKDISKFDTEYEASRKGSHAPCGCRHFDEPGDDPHAPYYRQHQIATAVEQLLCMEMGKNWQEHGGCANDPTLEVK